MLDGSNYTSWAQAITAALRSKGVWQIARGTEIRQEDLAANASTADKAERSKAQGDWDNRDDQALGLMQLKMQRSLHHHIGDSTTSSDLWDLLKGTYGVSGPAKVFADFKRTITFRVSGNGHPAPEIIKLQNLIDQLRLDGVELDAFLQAMILLSAIPPKWDNVPATILATKKKDELTFTLVRDALVTEYERRNTNVNSGSSAKKISNVKRKGPEPQHRSAPLPPQKGPLGSQGGDPQRKKTRRGNAKGKGKAKDGDYVSFAQNVIEKPEPFPFLIEIPDTPPPPSLKSLSDFPPLSPPAPKKYKTINGHGTVLTHKIQPAQKYICGNRPPPPPVYPDATFARKLADAINVNKSMANLSQLESTSTKRKAEDFPLGKLPRKNSPPPKKIVKSKEYVKDSDEISLDWGSDLDEEIGTVAGLPSKTCKSLSSQTQSVSDEFQLPQRLRLEVDSWSSPLYNFSNTFAFALSGLRTIDEKIKKHREECKTCKHGHHDSGEWIMDSGASLHFTGNVDDFSRIEYGDFGQTETANGITKITAIGTVFIKHLIELEDGSEYEKVSKLEPVFYLPKLSIRLLSMGTLLQQDLEIIGSSSRMIFRDMSTKRVEMTCAPHHDGQTIYWVKSEILKPRFGMANIKLDELHQRMGHPSDEVLKHMPRQTKGFDKLILPKERSICPGCAQGKMHSKTFPESQKRAAKIFEVIHSDLKEFPVVSYHGFKYYMSFLDDCSSFVWVTKLKKKSDAYDAFIKWIALVENQYEDECHIKTWHCDGGGEYITKKFIKKFEELGINLFRSAPHTPQQNGRAERFNRTIMDKAESMRHHAGLPGSWWEFSVDHAVHIYNRTPMKRLEWKTPYEPIHCEKPDISYIRVLGCGAYVWLPEAKRANKLSPKSELMIYLGVAPGIKGFKFMRMRNNIIFIGTTALFIEDFFPRKDREFVRNDPSQQIEESGNDDSHPHSPTPSTKEGEDEHDDSHSSPHPAPSPPDKDQSDLRRSTREKRKTINPDNVYGDRNPTDIDRNVGKDRFWKEVIEPGKDSNQNGSSDPSAGQNEETGLHPAPDTNSDDLDQQLDLSEDDLNRIVKEGGEPLINLLLMRASIYDDSIPQQFRDVLRLPSEQKDEWIKACKEEIEALRKRQVFDLVDLPKSKKPISNRWVFDVKADGRKRARLVAKGFQQKEGIDYNAIFSPVVRYETVRLMIALGALEKWHFEALDVKTAFLYGILD